MTDVKALTAYRDRLLKLVAVDEKTWQSLIGNSWQTRVNAAQALGVFCYGECSTCLLHDYWVSFSCATCEDDDDNRMPWQLLLTTSDKQVFRNSCLSLAVALENLEGADSQ